MTTRNGINIALYTGLCQAPPSWLSPFTTTHLSQVNEARPYYLADNTVSEMAAHFLNATTDTTRLLKGTILSRQILAINDLDELQHLRTQVQIGEMSRVIPYAQQTDHTAHTLYLYLLGVWMFVHSTSIRQRFATLYKHDQDSARLLDRFLFEWMYASLLHDVGYVFQGRHANEIRAVDRLFSVTHIATQLNSFNGINHKPLTEQLLSYYRSNILKVLQYEGILNPETILDRLRHVPWGKDIGLNETDAFAIMRMNLGDDNSDDVDLLEQYAYEVARSGYDGASDGVVDHGVASGLLLLQYCSLWYQFAAEVKFAGPFKTYKEHRYLKEMMVPAIFAASSHNIIGTHAELLRPSYRIDVVKHPLLFLSVLCDELQRWDRFPAGDKNIRKLELYEKAYTDSEGLQLTLSGETPLFTFENKSLRGIVEKSLNGRLANWEKLILLA